MANVYLSAGTFITKLNGRDITLLDKYAPCFDCDGFEFMMYPEYYGRTDEVVKYTAKVLTPVFHADKTIGDLLSGGSEEEYAKALEMFDVNLCAAKNIGASKAVFHCWGIPDSDRRMTRIVEEIGALYERSKSSGIDMLVENCVCVNGSPLDHLETLAREISGIGLIVDVRCAQFHGELERTMNSFIWKKNVRHVHISDFAGSYMDWTKLRPILRPTYGTIDWDVVWNGLKNNGYDNTFTLESPTFLPGGRIVPSLANDSIRYIREHIASK
ncbi:MAG TPA: sugar phosphate isomerase/epimerase [Bacillota bacterium]|nr:sugar phosphate isomerase/epimerase [Bacillota bacterium]